MINLVMFDTEKDLMKLTGLSHDGLWDAGFDLDDWDVGFMSEKPLTRQCKDSDGEMYYTAVSGADWLVMRMESYCVGYNHVEYKGRHYYTVHHA